jgi:hypothetical protein
VQGALRGKSAHRGRMTDAGWGRARPRSDLHPRSAVRPGWPSPPRRPPCLPARCADQPARRWPWPSDVSMAREWSSAGSLRRLAPWARAQSGAAPARRAIDRRPARLPQSRCGWFRRRLRTGARRKPRARPRSTPEDQRREAGRRSRRTTCPVRREPASRQSDPLHTERGSPPLLVVADSSTGSRTRRVCRKCVRPRQRAGGGRTRAHRGAHRWPALATLPPPR